MTGSGGCQAVAICAFVRRATWQSPLIVSKFDGLAELASLTGSRRHHRCRLQVSGPRLQTTNRRHDEFQLRPGLRLENCDMRRATG